VNLQNATAAAQILGIHANPDWNFVAENIPILRFEDGVTKEHGSYKGEGIKTGRCEPACLSSQSDNGFAYR